MGQRDTGRFRKQSGRSTLKLIIALIVVALILSLAWWGFSVFKDTGVSQVSTPPQAPRTEPSPLPVAPVNVIEKRPGPMQVEPLTVNFRYRSYYLHKAQLAAIREFMASLESPEGLEFHVDAYTCNKGTKSYNQYLSQKRASAVMRYLKARGVPGAAITMAAHGESDPVASNKTSSGRRQNRRASISVTGRR